MMKLARPRFKHDCKKCEFLGCFDEFDLYYCGQDTCGPTVIARWGNAGEQYVSGLYFARSIEPLGVAKFLAQRKGYKVIED